MTSHGHFNELVPGALSPADAKLERKAD